MGNDSENIMNNFSVNRNSEILQQLMNNVGIYSFKEFSDISGVSEWQLRRVEQGLLPKMSVETLLKLSGALQVSVNKLLEAFVPISLFPQEVIADEPKEAEINVYKQEYERLQETMATLEENLHTKWQDSCLDILESWLIYWPTAVAAADANPNLPAKKIIPLVKPVQKLLKSWGIEEIGVVGQQVTYNPQIHELIEGNAQEGEMVKVRNVGYKNHDKLFLKVKVSC